MSTCKDCAARRQMAREALYRAAVGEPAAIAEAAAHVIKGAAEIIGVKEKTGSAEMQSKRKTSGTAGTPPEVGNSEQEQIL